MIARVIHYCWFGRGTMPQAQEDCIKGWRKLMPDWQIIRWDESNFDVNICPYTAEAYKDKRWAFVSDVARLKALNEIGGIYLDTDVELFASLEPFLENRLFSGVEIYHKQFEQEGRPLLDEEGKPFEPMTQVPFCGFLSAVIGAEAGHPLIQECLDFYLNRKARNDDGSLNFIVIDGVLAAHAVKYGFRYDDRKQMLPEMTLYPPSIFAFVGVPCTDEAVLFHHTAWSWMPKTRKRRFFLLLDKMHLLKPYRKLKKILLHR